MANPPVETDQKQLQSEAYDQGYSHGRAGYSNGLLPRRYADDEKLKAAWISGWEKAKSRLQEAYEQGFFQGQGSTNKGLMPLEYLGHPELIEAWETGWKKANGQVFSGSKINPLWLLVLILLLAFGFGVLWFSYSEKLLSSVESPPGSISESISESRVAVQKNQGSSATEFTPLVQSRVQPTTQTITEESRDIVPVSSSSNLSVVADSSTVVKDSTAQNDSLSLSTTNLVSTQVFTINQESTTPIFQQPIAQQPVSQQLISQQQVRPAIAQPISTQSVVASDLKISTDVIDTATNQIPVDRVEPSQTELTDTEPADTEPTDEELLSIIPIGFEEMAPAVDLLSSNQLEIQNSTEEDTKEDKVLTAKSPESYFYQLVDGSEKRVTNMSDLTLGKLFLMTEVFNEEIKILKHRWFYDQDLVYFERTFPSNRRQEPIENEMTVFVSTIQVPVSRLQKSWSVEIQLDNDEILTVIRIPPN